jgi:YD repeat-containing protein
LFGAGWRSTYEESLSVGTADGYILYSRADGSTWAFASYGNPPTFNLIAPTNIPLVTLTEQGTTSPVWTITFENGEQRVFNGLYGGPLSAIVDRNGNTTTLTYTQSQHGTFTSTQLTTVTDPAGRHLNFAYNGSDLSLVSNITSDPGSGINIAYTYAQCYQFGCPLDIFGDLPVLTQVTQSDNTFITFDYSPGLMITSVNDMNGKVLEAHNFGLNGCNAGLTSSQANGVDALTLLFPNISSYCNPGGVGYPVAP